MGNNQVNGNPGNPGFLVGTGIYDVTGPAADRGMLGYSRISQKTSGIHMRSALYVGGEVWVIFGVFFRLCGF